MMLHRSTTLVLSGAALLALGACHPAKLGQGRNRDDRPTTVASHLTCPASEGSLTRVSVALDGRSCAYTDSDGREITLSLLALDGKTARAGLAAKETELQALLPGVVTGADAGSAALTANTKGDTADKEADDESKGDRTRIRLPGITIVTDGNDRAHIRAFGQSIDAKGDNAVIRGGWNGKEAEVRAQDGGAEIRAGYFGEKSVDATYLLASDKAGPTGVRAAGYVAMGPAAGPLVVAVETSKTSDTKHEHDRQYRDLRRLVRANIERR